MGVILSMLGQATSEAAGAMSGLDPILEAAARNWFWTMFAAVFIVGMISSLITNVFRSINQERSRREIAAYIAEGSMTPEQGERLMRARASSDEECG